MQEIGKTFRGWILSQRPGDHTPTKLDGDHIIIEAKGARAEITFYDFGNESEIVEFLIIRAHENEPFFFLHFALDDMSRAKELFGQLAEALAEEEARTTTHVLLCCTSAFTTSLFAAKMAEAARTLSLDYDFSALPVERAMVEADDYAVVLLAPQVASLRAQMKKLHPNVVVFEIPAKVFGSYDAVTALRLVLHALRDAPDNAKTIATLRAVRDLSDDRRVLIITLFYMRDHFRLGYRLYESGVGVTQGAVRKPELDFRDIDDLIDTLVLHDIEVSRLDAIGIAVPGVTYRGTVTLSNASVESYDLGLHLTRRLGIPVYVDNNCNAAAVGCYVSQDEVENLVFYRHAFGHEAGGFGTVIDGTLLKGRFNLAGEPKYFEHSFDLAMSYGDALWSADGMHELALNVVSACMALIAPDAVYLAVDTIDDVDEFRSLLLEIFEDQYVPDIHIVTDYVERVYLGELAMALQKLRNPHYRSLGVAACTLP